MAKRKEKWMQKASARMEKKGTEGSFTAYCKSHGFSGATSECIAYALAHGDTKTKRRAAFAKAAKRVAKKR